MNIRNYFKTAWRNVAKNKVYSIINIAGLSIGMAVAILIGLWIYDELSFDKYHKNYDRIAQVMQHEIVNGEINTMVSSPAVLAEEIRNIYGRDFKYVLQTSWNYDHTLAYGQNQFSKPGSFFEPEVTDMLSLEMIAGSRNGLKNDMNSILLSETVAWACFGYDDPLGKVLRVDNQVDVKVAGVYEDLPDNTTFNQLKFILPWNLYLSLNPWIKELQNPWGNNPVLTFAQIADHADMEKVSARIKDVKLNKVNDSEKRFNPTLFLHPMRKWHLYSSFNNGINTGGQISNVRLFGIIGAFVLLLACINFMNLSTARSEKRAKEVGIRKSIGSVRAQLITQFFSESVMVSFFALLLALILVPLTLLFFNDVAEKNIAVPWLEPGLWLVAIVFCTITGLFAGLYPALFLSSFQPVQVLKGTFKTGRLTSLPRRILVAAQFTISIMLIIGTIVVYKQINHAQNRPIGYNRNGLINVEVNEERHQHFEGIRSALKNEGVIIEMTESGSPTTNVLDINGGFDWEGKDPNQGALFPNNAVTCEYGKTIGWQIKEGRDFSREFITDSSAFILNESAVRYIGLKDPVGKIIRWDGRPYTVIGVVKDLLVQSPYEPVQPSLFHLSSEMQNVFIIKINPDWSAGDALNKIESGFKKYDPSAVFQVSFVDEEFARKFNNEKRIGTLAAFFAILAVLISCLGLFGLASYVAEQRTKEIGIRKVLGASVVHLWRMLSKEFVLLVLLSCFIAIPFAYYFLYRWLQNYEYRTAITWHVFAAAIGVALLITLLTVSFQAIKAAIANPVKSLRTE